MISNFSLRQRLHLLLELLYGECDARMRQEIKCSMLLSLRVQICLLSSVEFLCLAWRNDAVWFLYLVLKSFSVSPMYVSVELLSLRVTHAHTSDSQRMTSKRDTETTPHHCLIFQLTNQNSDQSKFKLTLTNQNLNSLSMWRVYNLHHTSVFTYSHANTPLGQSERAYYLSYFINIYIYIYQ